jgi:hypothetical protein
MTATGQICAEGYYCVGGAKNKNPRDKITGNICPKGAYCPENSSSPSICAGGTSTLYDGAVAVEDCKECYPGYYCPGECSKSRSRLIIRIRSGRHSAQI